MSADFWSVGASAVRVCTGRFYLTTLSKFPYIRSTGSLLVLRCASVSDVLQACRTLIVLPDICSALSSCAHWLQLVANGSRARPSVSSRLLTRSHRVTTVARSSFRVFPFGPQRIFRVFDARLPIGFHGFAGRSHLLPNVPKLSHKVPTCAHSVPNMFLECGSIVAIRARGARSRLFADAAEWRRVAKVLQCSKCERSQGASLEGHSPRARGQGEERGPNLPSGTNQVWSLRVVEAWESHGYTPAAWCVQVPPFGYNRPLLC